MDLLYEDLSRNEQQALIVGDFNAHEEEWLKSTATNARGRAVREFCESRGVLQLVTRPTRGDSILDLVIGPFEGNVSHLPHCGLSDHQTLLVSLDRVLETSCAALKRTVYHWKRAAWNRMKGEFQTSIWDLPNNVDSAVDMVTSRIIAVTNKYVPTTTPKMVRPFLW